MAILTSIENQWARPLYQPVLHAWVYTRLCQLKPDRFKTHAVPIDRTVAYSAARRGTLEAGMWNDIL